MNIIFFTENRNSATTQCALNVIKELQRDNHRVFTIKEENSNNSSFNSIRNKLSILTNIFRWPISSKKNYRKIVKEAEKIIKDNRIDLIISSYGSINSVLAGVKLKKKYSNITFAPCFFDALYGGSTLSFMPKKYCEEKAKRLQKKVFIVSNYVILMRSVENLFLNCHSFSEFQEKMIFCDLPMIVDGLYLTKNNTIFPKNIISFVYVGSLPNNIRNPKPVLDLFSIADKSFHLFLYGSNDYKNLEKQYISNSNIHFMGQVSRDKAIEVMNSADYLINIGNNLKYMTPSKVFEYMSLKKRIISFYAIDDDTSEVYLSHYPNHLSLNVKDNITDNYEKLKQYILESDVTIDIDFNDVDNYLFLNTPKGFTRKIEKVYDKKKNKIK